jgi:CO/xanthine dehydrogenase FAD-binding subunit
MLHRFEYAAPRERAELLDLLAARGRSAMLLAGGTDVLVNIRGGAVRPELVIDVKRVPGWDAITWSAADGLVIRPATTINALLRDAVVRERFPLLVACARDLASHQIRNRATVIGNIVNASPCADMAPALLCLEARVWAASTRGARAIPLHDFFTGVKRTRLEPDEVLERIVVPARSASARGGYRKLKRISGHDLGIVGVAAMKQDGRLRLGISSAAPTPVLVDGLLESTPADAVVDAVRGATSPISDVRCTREYREYMVEIFVRRLLQEVA